jgi:hypothetical protein
MSSVSNPVSCTGTPPGSLARAIAFSCCDGLRHSTRNPSRSQRQRVRPGARAHIEDRLDAFGDLGAHPVEPGLLRFPRASGRGRLRPPVGPVAVMQEAVAIDRLGDHRLEIELEFLELHRRARARAGPWVMHVGFLLSNP